jgi:hypothetical protein
VFEEETPGYLLLKALRSHIEVDIYASFEVHTEETIASGRERLAKFYELMGVSHLSTLQTINLKYLLTSAGLHHSHRR